MAASGARRGVPHGVLQIPAEAEYREAIRLDTRFAAAYRSLASLSHKQGRAREAKRAEDAPTRSGAARRRSRVAGQSHAELIVALSASVVKLL